MEKMNQETGESVRWAEAHGGQNSITSVEGIQTTEKIRVWVEERSRQRQATDLQSNEALGWALLHIGYVITDTRHGGKPRSA